MRILPTVLLAAALVAPVACAVQDDEPFRPEVYFNAPSDGATVDRSFDVVFGLRNYGVAPAGVEYPNTGHFHVLIDAEAPEPGVVIPADTQHLHYGLGQIETKLTLAPGNYTLRLVLGDHEHKVISEDLISKPIQITVR